MIERILPSTVVAVEARRDIEGVELFPEEERALGRAVEKRRREFTTARACARSALAELGLQPIAIPAGEHGEPRWPAQVIGSITHCRGYRACAVARSSDMLALGIDAEPHLALPPGLLEDIACAKEQAMLRELGCVRPDVHWDRLLFSAKESVYKTCFPLTERRLGFEDAVLSIDAHRFTARLLPYDLPPHDNPLAELSGRWTICDGVLATCIALPRPSERSGMLAPR